MLMRYFRGDSGAFFRDRALCLRARVHVCLYLTRPINRSSDSSLSSSLQLTLWSQEFQPLDMNATRRQIELERGWAGWGEGAVI